MGKASRERRLRVIAGVEKPFAVAELKNRLSRGTTEEQAAKVREVTKGQSNNKVTAKLIKTAEMEMAKGIQKYKSIGKSINPDSLLEEYDRSPQSQSLFNQYGLTRDWFVALAERKIKELKAYDTTTKDRPNTT